ncbi:hypothetical protein [Sphingobacterium lactis]|uniref:HTH cro/C1-type domain-containing protein n=1 Tax=Sphingobacterium lactis TaxID=797291 RepID=A0A1H6BP39_9SPHI|nr:hypothetical protein [Sphingobacterium lactis]SEG62444.1 hypothetical protein SAMN05421877_11134 [Sphingobacterium lactis]
MQTSLSENSSFFERIIQIIDYKGIKNVNIFATKCLGYDAPQKINRLKKPENNPSFEILIDIVNKFEEIDANWLLTGRGDMLKSCKQDSNVVALGKDFPSNCEELRDKYIKLLEDYNQLLKSKLNGDSSADKSVS